jgi:hypothetical protein
MDEYTEVWRKIREFDITHMNAYFQRRVRGIHAFSDEKKASMEEMLRELHVLSVGDEPVKVVEYIREAGEVGEGGRGGRNG